MEIMSNAQMKFDLPVPLSREVICSRIREGRKLLITHPGPESPMVSVEAHLLDAILQLATMRQPIMPKIALEFINSIVQGMTTEKEIIEWKMKHIPQHYQEDGTP